MTTEQITRIQSLADEAGTYGDHEMAAICEQALQGDPDAITAALDSLAA